MKGWGCAHLGSARSLPILLSRSRWADSIVLGFDMSVERRVAEISLPAPADKVPLSLGLGIGPPLATALLLASE